MRKFLAGLIVGIVLATGVSVMADGPVVKLFVNGVEIKSDVPPQIIAGRTLVPARPLAEALGAKVEWDAANSTVVVTNGVSTPTTPLSVTVVYKGTAYPATAVADETGDICVLTRVLGQFAAITADAKANTVTINGVTFYQSELAIVDGRSFASLRLLGQKLGWQYAWDESTMTATLRD